MNSSARNENGKTPGSAEVRVDGFLRFIVTLLVLAFPAATLFINRGDSYTLGLLMLIGIWVWMRDGARIWLNRDSGILCLVFALFFAVVLLSYAVGYQTEDGFHFLGRYFRFLLILPVYLAFRRYPPTAKTVFIGLALGALTAGVLASLEFLQAHGPIRVAAQTDLSIIFGDLTTTMVLCVVAGFGLMAASRRHWSVPLLILCMVGGVAATLLSGTRGAWIPMLLLPLVLMTPLGGFLKRRYVVAIVLVLVSVFSSLYFIAGSGTQERITVIASNLSNYFIGLKTAKPQTYVLSMHAHCDNETAFLNAWMSKGHLSANLNRNATVVSDPHMSRMPGCITNHVVRLQNDSNSVAVAVFDRISPQIGGSQSTELLVRGKGKVYFTGAEQRGVRFDTSDYLRVKLVARSVFGRAIGFEIPPDANVWLVPLDGYFGEYSMTLANTSVGQRFELWRAAWHLFLKHPWLGVGTGAFQIDMQQLIHTGVIAPFVGTYDHPHDDYLDAFASRGLLGFGTLLAILLIPLWRFLRATRSSAHATHAIGLAGVLTVVGFTIYALTDTIFLHSIMITWYVIYMALFYSLLDTRAASQTNLKPVK